MSEIWRFGEASGIKLIFDLKPDESGTRVPCKMPSENTITCVPLVKHFIYTAGPESVFTV